MFFTFEYGFLRSDNIWGNYLESEGCKKKNLNLENHGTWYLLYSRFWHKRQIDNFDPHNVLLAIATHITQRLMIGGSGSHVSLTVCCTTKSHFLSSSSSCSLISCLVFWTSLTQSSSSRTEAQEPQPELVLDGGAGEQVPASTSAAWGPHQLSWRPLMNWSTLTTSTPNPPRWRVRRAFAMIRSPSQKSRWKAKRCLSKTNRRRWSSLRWIGLQTAWRLLLRCLFLRRLWEGFESTDVYSDSGCERSPSPFSNISSPLCSEGSWDDMFATELFPPTDQCLKVAHKVQLKKMPAFALLL